MIMAGLGLGVQVGVQLSFGRTHKSEADLIGLDWTGLDWTGLDLMAKAGFDPRQSIDLWQNMAKAMEGYTLVVNKPNCKI
jgi:predicted Zn-dependent protease